MTTDDDVWSDEEFMGSTIVMKQDNKCKWVSLVDTSDLQLEHLHMIWIHIRTEQRKKRKDVRHSG